MKQLSIYVALFGCVSLFGCKKYLEQSPDNRTQLDNPQKVSQLLATAYPQANYMAFAESISDNAVDRSQGAIYPENRDPFFFKDVENDQQDSPEFYWNACYSAAAAANQALEVIEQAGSPAAYSAQKGEALVARAYAHFMLVTFFSRYDSIAPANSSDMGIPYVTKPEKIVFANYDRGTVKGVYENIEKDLLAGLPLLVDQGYTVPKYHFTRAAANAFASRFYLFKKDYAKVVEFANKVFGGNFQPNLRPWNTTYKPLTFGELITRYNKATEPANLLLVDATSWWGRGSGSDAGSSYASNRYGLDPTLFNQVFRTPVSGGTWIYQFQTYVSGNGYYQPKVYENFAVNNISANTGRGYVMVPLFTVEEVLFNKAEANAKLGNTASSIQDLNAYISTRINNYSATTHTITAAKILAYYSTTNIMDGVISTVLDFKRAEFMHEGMRWLDLVRYKIPVVHKELDGTTVLQTMTLAADDNRRVFQLPSSVKLAGLPLNPR
ncbi:MAG TPA: RagB/SusD family nutrient uptake outer membrane protein [Flavisolibacter sp.]|nr:RagB/SusD family nutrient uptake outer membrane protein [Flavisolibacter sp.]